MRFCIKFYYEVELFKILLENGVTPDDINEKYAAILKEFGQLMHEQRRWFTRNFTIMFDINENEKSIKAIEYDGVIKDNVIENTFDILSVEDLLECVVMLNEIDKFWEHE